MSGYEIFSISVYHKLEMVKVPGISFIFFIKIMHQNNLRIVCFNPVQFIELINFTVVHSNMISSRAIINDSVIIFKRVKNKLQHFNTQKTDWGSIPLHVVTVGYNQNW